MNKATFSEQFYNRLVNDYSHALDYDGISGKRVAMRLAELTKIGLTEHGGSYRLGYSAEEREAKEVVKSWMRQADLTVYQDDAGNVFGRYHGEAATPVILAGSHVDSVPNGGHFDGPLGVIAALEVVEAWRAVGYQPSKTYEVVVFSDEEGARFNAGYTGSQAMVGELELEKQLALSDQDGQSFKKVVEGVGLNPEQLVRAKRDLADIAAYVEVHIEQGKKLENSHMPVGVVTGIAGPYWLDIVFLGEANHAGNTPMTGRKDALLAASQFIAGLPSLPAQFSPTAVATVGKINVSPNGTNIIPGEVRLTVDIRDIDQHARRLLIEAVKDHAKQVAQELSIQVNMEEALNVEPVQVDQALATQAQLASEEILGQAYPLHSGAGHDAMILGNYLPMAMLFTRSEKGISHNPEEWSSLNDCVHSIHVLKRLIEKTM
ncbi:Zn-dependent hydrolase [Amphibacillus jilinensis]|uniref:Zn-dependent hydrolase n=1 Tax=Amphibacillus jilinensis TaxID=1216008 RepID=UPI00031CA5C6|nr:Zn-dependent hydrolase [Amphibacillus jilinensis]